jgi:transcriptional regulator with XRE-family HTH domain
MATSPLGDSTGLGSFLRARRAAVDPEAVGLRRGRRRVPGLRREEVATLAGVSVDYYTRLEQERERHPSAQLLEALTRSLRLTADERLHLYRLAAADPTVGRARAARAASSELVSLMARWPMNPAFVYDDTQEILASNPLGDAFHAPFALARNFAQMVFVDPEGRRFFREWETVANGTVASLRQAWGKPTSRERVSTLVEEMRGASGDFAMLWESNSVLGKGHERKAIAHPEIGDLDVHYLSFDIPGVPDQHLLVCDVPAGSASEVGFRLLGSLVPQQAVPGVRG